MIRLQVLMLQVLASGVLAQPHGPCVRVFTHTPIHELIFLPKILMKEQPTIADFAPGGVVGDTNLISHLFDESSKERVGLTGSSCASEVPVDRVTIHCAGNLLTARNVTELLNCTVVVPRKQWLEHQAKWKRSGRYMFTLRESRDKEFTMDLREGGCAIVFFPDETYRCIMDRGYASVRPLQQKD